MGNEKYLHDDNYPFNLDWHPDMTNEQVLDVVSKGVNYPHGEEYDAYLEEIGLKPLIVDTYLELNLMDYAEFVYQSSGNDLEETDNVIKKYTEDELNEKAGLTFMTAMYYGKEYNLYYRYVKNGILMNKKVHKEEEKVSKEKYIGDVILKPQKVIAMRRKRVKRRNLISLLSGVWIKSYNRRQNLKYDEFLSTDTYNKFIKFATNNKKNKKKVSYDELVEIYELSKEQVEELNSKIETYLRKIYPNFKKFCIDHDEIFLINTHNEVIETKLRASEIIKEMNLDESNYTVELEQSYFNGYTYKKM